jgi:selenocysteine-specific translation elongation factor
MSPSVTVALVGATGVAKELAKKSTASDITLFHQVQDGHALTLVEPTQYPEKFPPLLYALALSDRAVLVANQLDRGLAETAATLDLFDLPAEVRHGPGVGPDELARAFRGLRIERASVSPLDLLALREELGRAERAPVAGEPIVVLDHYFPVKGVGTVALGFVRQGTLRPHAALRLYPTDRTVEVRSVQVHDVDVKEAASGERVGVALKGVEVDELARGQLLAPEGELRVGTTLEGSAGHVSPYYRGDLVAGAQLHALIGLQFVPAAVTSHEGERIVVETDRPVAWGRGDALVLADLSTPKGARGVGRWSLPS